MNIVVAVQDKYPMQLGADIFVPMFSEWHKSKQANHGTRLYPFPHSYATGYGSEVARVCDTGYPCHVYTSGRFSLLLTCVGCVEVEDSSCIPFGTMED